MDQVSNTRAAAVAHDSPPEQVAGLVPQDVLQSLSGFELLQGIGNGRFPAAPIAVLLGFYPVEIEPGRVVFAALPRAHHYNPLGSVHGGFISTLLDSCMGCAIHSKLTAGNAYTTLELKVNFVRPVSEATGEVRAEGKIIHLGRQVATAEGRLVDGRGRLLAHATTTCMIFWLPGATPSPS
jgi:uncharacterized protein (TIGR00369 family)